MQDFHANCLVQANKMSVIFCFVIFKRLVQLYFFCILFVLCFKCQEKSFLNDNARSVYVESSEQGNVMAKFSNSEHVAYWFLLSCRNQFQNHTVLNPLNLKGIKTQQFCALLNSYCKRDEEARRCCRENKDMRILKINFPYLTIMLKTSL